MSRIWAWRQWRSAAPARCRRPRGLQRVAASPGATAVARSAARVDVGGLVGGNDGSITASYSSGSVSGTDAVGGLVGDNEGSIVASYSTGSVSGSSSVAALWASTAGSIARAIAAAPSTALARSAACGPQRWQYRSSYSSGTVSGTDDVGGLVGDNSQGSIATSYSSGSVSGTNRCRRPRGRKRRQRHYELLRQPDLRPI